VVGITRWYAGIVSYLWVEQKVPPQRHPKPVRPTLRLHVVQRFAVLAVFTAGVSTSPPADAASTRCSDGVDGALRAGRSREVLLIVLAAVFEETSPAVFSGDSGVTVIGAGDGVGDGATDDCSLSLNSSSPKDRLKQTEHMLLRGAEPKNPQPPAQRLEVLLLHIALSMTLWL
jgi:hypothetical protein